MYFSYLAIMHYVNLVLTWPVRNSSAAMFHRPLKQPNPKKKQIFLSWPLYKLRFDNPFNKRIWWWWWWLFNIRSLKGKSSSVSDNICSERRDVFAVVGTWHDDTSSPSLLLTCPPAYSLVERARPRAVADDQSLATNHGGIAVLLTHPLNVSD